MIPSFSHNLSDMLLRAEAAVLLTLVTVQLVRFLIGMDVIQYVLKVPEHVINRFESPPVDGGTVLNLFEPPPVLRTPASIVSSRLLTASR